MRSSARGTSYFRTFCGGPEVGFLYIYSGASGFHDGGFNLFQMTICRGRRLRMDFMSHTKKILLIDDDPELRQLLAAYLGRHGFDTLLLPDTCQLDAYLERYQPHLIVLDLMLPGEDGLAACRRLRVRGEKRPVIMLTARDEPIDRVIGLQMGADDYLGKPFDPRELVARIESVLRRASPPLAVPVADGGQYRFGEWALDRATRQLLRNDESIMLTSGEFALLCALISHAGQPMKRERLLELTRGDESETFDRAVDVQIHRLRRMIEADPAHPRYLQTVWGVGYVFVPDAINTATPQP